MLERLWRNFDARAQNFSKEFMRIAFVILESVSFFRKSKECSSVTTKEYTPRIGTIFSNKGD
jgi:hypothetical protein